MKFTKFSKRILCILFSLVLIVSLVGCTSNSTNSTQSTESTEKAAMYKAGTYTASAPGINGDIKVEVVVDDNSIKNVKVIEHNESPNISDVAIERIPKSIIENQSLAVDVVAGATISSKGIIEAATAAIKEAGGDIEALSIKNETVPTATDSVETTEYNTDVVVIGGGGAGLAAAVSAHQNGAQVIVLEKMPRVGGNTIISGSAFNAVDPGRQKALGIEDSIDKHFTQTYEGGDKLGNPELIRTFVENAYPAVEWLESMGMEFKPDVFTVLGGLWPRAHKPVKPLGTGYIETYLNYIDKSEGGIKVLVDTKATELIFENDRVVGVKAKDLNGNIVLKANKGVVMATGGFGANVEMRDKYNKIWPELTNLKTTNHPGATGDGLNMAEKVGASLIGLEHIQLLPMGDPETGSLSGNIEQGVENRIFVNKDGNRFIDEGARRDVMTQGLFEQEDTFMWIILDKHSYPTGDTRNNFNEPIDDLIKQGRAYKADTLEELAKKIGVSPENLVNTVADFNKAVEAGNPDKFGRTLFADKIDTPPFYAGGRVPTVHHTMGGIAINTKAQALDKDGNVIPGLYAAGEVTGGIHGANRLGGNALADIAVFGKIAGENVALEK